MAAIDIPDGKGGHREFSQEEFPRPGIAREKRASLKPAFRKDGKGSVTAGNSSGVTDGAAALLVTNRSVAQRLGIPVEARLIDYAVVGVEPEIMGAGPVPAIRTLLEKHVPGFWHGHGVPYRKPAALISGFVTSALVTKN